MWKMKSKRQSMFTTPLIMKQLLGGRFIQLVEPLKFYCAILDIVITIPKGFICDLESVPLLKGSNPLAGVLHDFLCRFDSIPIVSRLLAARLYLNAQKSRDVQAVTIKRARAKNWFKRWLVSFNGGTRAVKRWGKTGVVSSLTFYYHKHSVHATLEELQQ